MAYRLNPDTDEMEWYDEAQEAYILERLAADPSYGSVEMPEISERARELVAGIRTGGIIGGARPLPEEGGVSAVTIEDVIARGEVVKAGVGGDINWGGIVAGLVSGFAGGGLVGALAGAGKALLPGAAGALIGAGIAAGGNAGGIGSPLSPIPGIPLVGLGVPEPPAAYVKRRWETRVYDNQLGYIKLNFYHLVDGRVAMYHNTLKYWKVWRLKKPIVLGSNMNLKNVIRVAKSVDRVFGAVEGRIKKSKVKRRAKRRVC